MYYLNDSTPVWGRHEFIKTRPDLAVPSLIILGFSTLAGTFGNILILVSVATKKYLQNAESVFIVNLACSDLFVTSIADPMSIIAKMEGEQFFKRTPGLCRAIGSLCTISCVASLMTIAAMSCNRYVFIVHNHHYRKIFRTRNCFIMCLFFYIGGLILVLLNIGNIGNHHFDHKSLECIWERMHTYAYTVIFFFILVWIPIIVIGISYLHMYLHVRSVRNRVHNNRPGAVNSKSSKPPSTKLAQTLFLIYIVFSACWIPYSLLAMADAHNVVRHEVYLFIVAAAHLHPSINWLVYYFTNKKFHQAFVDILQLHRCISQEKKEAVAPSSTHAPPATTTQETDQDKQTGISTISK